MNPFVPSENTVIHQGGQQKCVSCRGCGYRHDSSMPHDKPEGQKCFFCKECPACNGRGLMQGGTTIIHEHSVNPFVPSGGQGFNPNGGQGFYPNGGQGFNPNGGQGFNPNGGQGFYPNGGQGSNPNGGQGFNPNGGQGFYPNGGQGFNPNGGRGPYPNGGQGPYPNGGVIERY